MRFITGLIVGIGLTVGAAYITDAMTSAPASDQAGGRRMVNWEVVNGNLHEASVTVHDGWAKLVGKAREIDKKTGI